MHAALGFFNTECRIPRSGLSAAQPRRCRKPVQCPGYSGGLGPQIIQGMYIHIYIYVYLYLYLYIYIYISDLSRLILWVAATLKGGFGDFGPRLRAPGRPKGICEYFKDHGT